MKINFKECKEISLKFVNGEITPLEFEEWSKKHCDPCKFFIGKSGKKHCIFGKLPDPKN